MTVYLKMINRNSTHFSLNWGYSYLIARGEILGFFKDELMRKHLSRMFSCDQERKKRDQRRSDTVVIFLSINDADQGWGVMV